jgi:hypothetical protein
LRTISSGGSWVALVPPQCAAVRSADGFNHIDLAGEGDFTLILEKLEGDCLRCTVGKTSPETLSFVLQGSLKGTTSLNMWVTNSTHSLVVCMYV